MSGSAAIPDFVLSNPRGRQFKKLSPEHQAACKQYSLSEAQKVDNYIKEPLRFYSDCFLRYINEHFFDSIEWFPVFLSIKAARVYRALPRAQQEAAFRHCTLPKTYLHSPAQVYSAKFLNLVESGQLQPLTHETASNTFDTTTTTVTPVVYFCLQGEAMNVFKKLSKQQRSKVREHCEEQAARFLNGGGSIENRSDYFAKIFDAYLREEYYGFSPLDPGEVTEWKGTSVGGSVATMRGNDNENDTRAGTTTGGGCTDAVRNNNHTTTVTPTDRDIETIKRLIQAKESEKAKLLAENTTLRNRNLDLEGLVDQRLELVEEMEFLEERHENDCDAKRCMQTLHTHLLRDVCRLHGSKKKFAKAVQAERDASKQKQSEIEHLQMEEQNLMRSQKETPNKPGSGSALPVATSS